MNNDERYMKEALKQAKKAAEEKAKRDREIA